MSQRLPLILLALAISSVAFGEDIDPPGRVARLSVIRGEVSFQAGDAQAPEDAILNRPVTSGDRLMTESKSRAELTLGIAAIRLDERTDLSIADLDDDIVQLEVNSGTVSVHLRELYDGDTFEVDLPHSTVRLLEPGDYRVDVRTDGTALLAVRRGEAEMDDGNGPVVVRDGEEAQLSPNDRSVKVGRLGAPDDFDEWSVDRERQLTGAVASRYVSRDVVGYEDLDRYGSWYSEPGYGEVWAPRFVSLGWAPYRFGRWVWVRPWGWTWIDHSPWGFAPFHYGRWAHVRQRWCWVPGPRHHRAVFAPALVAWSDGHSRGGYHSRDRRPREWIPLAPREVYVPAHRASPRYLRKVNVTNTLIARNTDITNAARNLRVIRERRDARVAERLPDRSAKRPAHPVPPRRDANSTTRDTSERWSKVYRAGEAARPAHAAQPVRNAGRDRSSEATRPQRQEQSNNRSQPNRGEAPSRGGRNGRTR